MTETQDLGDALYDATAAGVMAAIGNALLIPYYRCGGVSEPDESLDRRVREDMNRMTRTELEQNIKKNLFVDGHDMDLSSPGLSNRDRAVVEHEMKLRSLDFADRSALVEMAFGLWRGLDYLKGAKRVDGGPRQRMWRAKSNWNSPKRRRSHRNPGAIIRGTGVGLTPLV